MKKSLLILLTFIFTATSCFAINNFLPDNKKVNSNYNDSRHCIVLDAGHGGADGGTIAANGTPEKEINLAIVLALYDFLNVTGVKCKAIRSGDYEYYPDKSNRSRSDLYNRLDFVNETENAILVSIHQNFFESTAESGMQIWYTKNVSSSKILADKILNNTKIFLQQDNTRINKESDDSYYILYKASVPSVMVECGFMSNPEEEEKLESDSYQKQLACVIALGINQYINEE